MAEESLIQYKKLGPFEIDIATNTAVNKIKLVSGDTYVGILDEAGNRNGPGMYIN